MTASPRAQWIVLGMTGAISLVAWLRHRDMVARGTEEPEPTPEEAAAEDHDKLVKLSKKLAKH